MVSDYGAHVCGCLWEVTDEADGMRLLRWTACAPDCERAIEVLRRAHAYGIPAVLRTTEVPREP